MEPTRRAFLKRSAIAGGVIWAAPAITSLAHVPAAGSPRCACTGEAYALLVNLNDPARVGPYPSVPNGPCEPINLTVPATFVGTACATLAGCSASATLTSFSISAAGLTVVGGLVKGTQSLDCCKPTVGAEIVGLTINGTAITVGAPNATITLGDLTITVNEQVLTCNPATGAETSEANVVHIHSPTLFAGTDIWLGHTKLISSGGKCC